METKPYSLQSPEQIAKDYGGNKQKIANAAQMGLLDPTAAVMAGMFIDRMRSAQQQEQQPQQTVAQQVFSPQPPAPPMGAAPQGAPPQQPMPQQPMPQQPMPQQGGQPPMGMAGGGLMDLSIDPSMFDEPSNGAYAGGGLVAFADGGEVFWLPGKGQYVNADGEPVSAPAPGSIVDVGAQRLIGSGYVRSGSKYTVPEPVRPRLAVPRVTAEEMRATFGTPRPPAPAPRRQNPAYDGPSMTPEAMLAAMGPRPAPARAAPMAGPQPQAAPVPARGLGAIAPQQAPAMPPAAAPAQGAAASTAPAGPERPTLTAAMDEMKGLYGDLPTSARDAMSAYWERMASPEAMAAQKKQDMWSAMAQMGFNMASSNSPYFLQAVGQAGAQAVPAMQAAAKERRAMEREGLQARAGIEGQQRAERADMVKGASSLYGTQLQEYMGGLDREQRMQLQREAIASNEKIARENNATQIQVAGMRGSGGGGGGGSGWSEAAQQLAEARYQALKAVPLPPGKKRKSDAELRASAMEYAIRLTRTNTYNSGGGGDSGAFTDPEQQVGGGRTSPQSRPPLSSFAK